MVFYHCYFIHRWLQRIGLIQSQNIDDWTKRTWRVNDSLDSVLPVGQVRPAGRTQKKTRFFLWKASCQQDSVVGIGHVSSIVPVHDDFTRNSIVHAQ